jgi:hypothetical protein
VTDPEPVEAVRSKPGEYFLATEHVQVGLRFKVHGALYEITGEPTKWGIAYVADVTVIEGLRPGSVFRAMLHTGRRMDT